MTVHPMRVETFISSDTNHTRKMTIAEWWRHNNRSHSGVELRRPVNCNISVMPYSPQNQTKTWENLYLAVYWEPQVRTFDRRGEDEKAINIVRAFVERVGEMSANISNKGKQELVCCWPSLLDINRFASGRFMIHGQ